MIVIPMAGLSRRFTEAGYTVPKYQLPVAGESLFSLTVKSFQDFFSSELFVFAYRNVADTRSFLERECAALGISQFHLTEIDEPTEGQAHTVDLAVRDVSVADEPMVIFNIDTIRPGWRPPTFPDARVPDGYLEVVRAAGEGWSFVDPGPAQSVLRTTEKQRISDLCSTGLYEFRTASLFRSAFAEARERSITTKGEYYVAPLYNILIERGLAVSYYEIAPEDVRFSGVPDEYEELVRTTNASERGGE
ncbi:glycosyltransferase family protein [Microbacterium gorillae]|uniref:hypothetical protein n=1 Tax=Microbacterium gorillae TaxID=1231063 RepID=UPI0005907F23|nr:hypothetical protein [Microbacterium gorillae]